MEQKNIQCPKCGAKIGMLNTGLSLYPFAFKCSTCKEKLKYKNILGTFFLVLLAYFFVCSIILKAMDQYLLNSNFAFMVVLSVIFGIWLLFLYIWLKYIKASKEITPR